MSDWSIAAARHTYSILHWGDGYFDINAAGEVVAQPHGPNGEQVSLPNVVNQARASGLKLPLLVRFTDILGDRIARLQSAFKKAMHEVNYAGAYTAVYPIKVNQHQSVAGELVNFGNAGFGLEAGSKPELMAVLALSRGGTVICNGYKDREYIRLALIGKKLGLDVFIVIEKPSELRLVIEESRALNVKPLLGVRMRLATIGAGKWQNTGGDKAKFGLNPRQLLTLLDELKKAGLSDCLKLMHFHMGSQISNVRDIASGMREVTRYLVELTRLGVDIRYLDVGGGLGIDYEGTRSRSECSINYGMDQYAATIVSAVAEVCAEHQIEPFHIITEAGRAMTAHHAVLIANVSEVERAPLGEIAPARAQEHSVLRHLRDIYAALGKRPALELFHEAQYFLGEGLSLYALGQFSLADRAQLDDLYYAIANDVRDRLKLDERSHRQAFDELTDKLVDKYFVNFSVFQSMPDVWAIDQVFPIMPIARLNEKPTRRGVIADLTCDSDGRIDLYVDSEGVDSSLPLHTPDENAPYHLATFLVGAYQETLGDIHNLFGDTDAVDVRLTRDGYELMHPKRGDTCDRVLSYVGFAADDFRLAYAEKIRAANLSEHESKVAREALEIGLIGYTYLAEAPSEHA